MSGFKSKIEDGDPSRHYHLILMGDEKDEQAVLIHSEGMLIAQQESDQISKRPGFEATLNGK